MLIHGENIVHLPGTDSFDPPQKDTTLNDAHHHSSHAFHLAAALDQIHHYMQNTSTSKMNSIRRLASSAFFKTAGHIRPPMRSFVSSKLVPAATGAAVFGIGCMSRFLHQPIHTLQAFGTPTRILVLASPWAVSAPEASRTILC